MQGFIQKLMHTRIPMAVLACALLPILGTVAIQVRPASAADSSPAVPAHQLLLPNKQGSLRFAVIGDSGTGEAPQFETAAEIARFREQFPFDFVLMLGDNLYGGSKPIDFEKKFEQPYKALLDRGVKFYASLGNHDGPNERFYELFNMGGQRYYNFKKGNAEFFALDSNYMDPEQLQWIDQRLAGAGSAWKICFFHHPLYSDGKFHGPDLDLRQRLEPILEKDSANLILAGHEHLYERIVPQHGIYYFVLGCSGELRAHGLQPSAATAKGFDSDRAFLLIEINGDNLYFQAVSRQGLTVDSGSLTKQSPAK
jgi:hypothetical protein